MKIDGAVFEDVLGRFGQNETMSTEELSLPLVSSMQLMQTYLLPSTITDAREDSLKLNDGFFYCVECRNRKGYGSSDLITRPDDCHCS